MTVSVIERLRRSRGDNTWLEDLKAGSTESFVEEIRGLLSDPEWDYGPASLVSSYLTGPTKYVLAEKDNGTVLRVMIEGEATKFKLGEVDLRETPESIPTIAEEVLHSARSVVDHLFSEDTDKSLDVEATLLTLSEALRKEPGLFKDIQESLTISDIAPDKLWYSGQLPSSVATPLTEDSAIDKALSTIKGRVASVIEQVKEHGELDSGLSMVAEAVLDHSEKAIRLLNSCLSEAEDGESRRARGVMSAVPTIDKALVFIQNELSEAVETKTDEAQDQEADTP